MLLKERLERKTKEKLLQCARSYGLHNYSRLRKSELAAYIADYFCSDDVLRNRLSCMSDEEVSIIRKAGVTGQKIPLYEIMYSLRLTCYNFGYHDEATGLFFTYEDVTAGLNRIDDEEFKSQQSRRSWLLKCVRFLKKYYGIAPVEVLYKLYHLKVKESIDDMIYMLEEMPTIISEIYLLPTKDTKINLLTGDYNPIYSRRGLLAMHIEMMEKDKSAHMLNIQEYIDYYIPSVQQIEEIYKYGYEFSLPVYRKLRKFFQREYDMPFELACLYISDIANSYYDGQMVTDIINMFAEEGLDVVQGEQLEELLDLLDDAYNCTRLRENRGYTDNEIDLLEAEDVEQPLRLEDRKVADTVRVNRKIYPNDPCPCGSGKKYKKCCGRN